MARALDSYRGARRNECLRGAVKGVWGPKWYYALHSASYHRRTILSRTPSKYHPLKAMRDYVVDKAKTIMERRQAAGARLGLRMRGSSRGQ